MICIAKEYGTCDDNKKDHQNADYCNRRVEMRQFFASRYRNERQQDDNQACQGVYHQDIVDVNPVHPIRQAEGQP